MQSQRRTIVVAGNGMVGHKLVETLVQRGATAEWDVHVFGEEARPAYDRVALSSLFDGATPDELTLAAPDFYDGFGLALHLGQRVASIDLAAQNVTSDAGTTLHYDELVLATGSYPFVPPVPNADATGCFVYRTIADLEAIREYASRCRTGAVIGGGLLGLEAANALRLLGLDTHVVEFAPRLMPVQVDDGGGAVLRRRIEELGVSVHTGMQTSDIVLDADDRVAALRFANEGIDDLDIDIVVFSAGIRPRDDVARGAGLAVGERGGVVIDEQCRTSDPCVWAIGECALYEGRIFGLVSPGYAMARVVADRIVGGDATFTGADMSTKLKLMGVDVASFGDAHAAAPDAETIVYSDAVSGVYRRLVVADGGTRVTGGVLVGDATAYTVLSQMARGDMPTPEQPAELILPVRDAAGGPVLGVGGLSASATVCSCNNVTKGAICDAIATCDLRDVGGVKAATTAGTGCGGCVPLVTDILQHELRNAGVAVSDALCEHFAYSRRALFDIVRVERIVSFSELLARHGRGKGCEICKPAVASILASCWNEFVLADAHAPQQDTNDYFLANMQKDGTYSVVPRVPGGEITPDKLISIGQVAKRFGLYTKITGAQRIDLFGAQVHQLPLVWAELIAAGFESGHAYGKAVRTVKSCVGSTWCRYGMQDSVALAIELEHRYKGLRAPHKIKLGVSGCTRECAEAQAKDVGVIATEKGWNLYVCGNGGMRPRHAELLASDLDKNTLIRYIDRFLMFYIRTADRLQRTATWRDNLEGGLDYVKQVVCEDSLGIAAELETDMARIVASYECEWKKAIEDPVTLKRFRHFVNSDAPDGDVIFVQERGQIRPATRTERGERSKVAP